MGHGSPGLDESSETVAVDLGLASMLGAQTEGRPDLHSKSMDIPDLNHSIDQSISANEESVSVNANTPLTSKTRKKVAKQGVCSLKFRDLVRNPNLGRHRHKRKEKVVSESVNSKEQSSPVASFNSVSVEVEKTMALGKDIGFQMEDSREALRAVIEGEGASKLNK